MPVSLLLKAHWLFVSVAISCGIVYLSWLLQGPGGLNYWLGWPEKLSYLATDRQVWRLWTPAIQHFSLLHLLVNLFFFYWLTQLWLQQRKAYHLLVFILLAGIASNAAEAAWTSRDFGGLSGVVYALLGFELVMLGARLFCNITQACSDVMQRPELVIGLLGLLLLGFTGLFNELAAMAHLGGLVFGGLYACAFLIAINHHYH